MIPCDKADDIREIRNDVKELLAFKNKAMGIIIAISTIMNIIVLIITNFIAKK